jgi:hypothetical protein
MSSADDGDGDVGSFSFDGAGSWRLGSSFYDDVWSFFYDDVWNSEQVLELEAWE